MSIRRLNQKLRQYSVSTSVPPFSQSLLNNALPVPAQPVNNIFPQSLLNNVLPAPQQALNNALHVPAQPVNQILNPTQPFNMAPPPALNNTLPPSQPFNQILLPTQPFHMAPPPHIDPSIPPPLLVRNYGWSDSESESDTPLVSKRACRRDPIAGGDEVVIDRTVDLTSAGNDLSYNERIRGLKVKEIQAQSRRKMLHKNMAGSTSAESRIVSGGRYQNCARNLLKEQKDNGPANTDIAYDSKIELFKQFCRVVYTDSLHKREYSTIVT